MLIMGIQIMMMMLLLVMINNNSNEIYSLMIDDMVMDDWDVVGWLGYNERFSEYTYALPTSDGLSIVCYIIAA